MRAKTNTNNKEVADYLQKEFGTFQYCHTGCGVFVPPDNALIEVMEPLQTCHPKSGGNLDKQQCIPQGIYRVGKIDVGMSSHYLELIPIRDGEEHPDEKVMAFVGYSNSDTVDWRGARKYSPL